MKKVKYLLQNGLPSRDYESKRRRVLASVCTQQIYLIPTVGIMYGDYTYKIRIGFAFLIFLVSFGFWRTRYARLSEEEA